MCHWKQRLNEETSNHRYGRFSPLLITVKQNTNVVQLSQTKSSPLHSSCFVRETGQRPQKRNATPSFQRKLTSSWVPKTTFPPRHTQPKVCARARARMFLLYLCVYKSNGDVSTPKSFWRPSMYLFMAKASKTTKVLNRREWKCSRFVPGK